MRLCTRHYDSARLSTTDVDSEWFTNWIQVATSTTGFGRQFPPPLNSFCCDSLFHFPSGLLLRFFIARVSTVWAFRLNRLRTARGFLQAATVNRHKHRTPVARDSHALCVKISRQAGWAFWCTCDFIGVFAQKSVGTAGAKSFLETG